MGDTPITKRQQHWLDHIRAADAFDGSIADYARSEGLKPKELCLHHIPATCPPTVLLVDKTIGGGRRVYMCFLYSAIIVVLKT
jgi:hypothetical protein